MAADTTQEEHIQAFCDPTGVEVFHAIQHKNDIYKRDAFDVPEINAAARRRFSRLIERHSRPELPSGGSILLLKGRAGSGKTHLMRAFRGMLHGERKGYFGYLQLTSNSDNYARYILCGLVDHLERPYDEGNDDRSGLRRLSDDIAEKSAVLKLSFKDRTEDALQTLREEELHTSMIVRAVECLAPLIVKERQFEHIDIDIVRVLLYLQTGDPVLENKVKKYLRCETMTAQDEAALGGVHSLTDGADPARVLRQLGDLMWRSDRQVLVIAIDQLEDIFSLDHAKERFRRATATLRALADDVPSAIIVLACLEDYYIELRQYLTKSVLDRIEEDPEAMLLREHTVEEELASILGQRLRHLYAEAGLGTPKPNHFPFTNPMLAAMQGLTIRDALSRARRWQEGCMDAGELTPFESVAPASDAPPAATATGPAEDVVRLEQAWNEHYTEWRSDPPTESEALAALLAEGLTYCRYEAGTLEDRWFSRRGTDVLIEGVDPPRWAAVCNRGVQGGGLLNELRALDRRAENGYRKIIVRAAGYPRTATSQTAKHLAELVEGGGICIQMENSEWRAITAMEAFRQRHADDPAFEPWLTQERPLTRLPSFRQLLDLDGRRRREAGSAPAPRTEAQSTEQADEPASPTPPTTERADTASHTTPPPVSPPGAAAAPSPSPATAEDALPMGAQKAVLIGHTAGVSREPVTLDPAGLTRHVAFLGGSGCGKTTLAMRLLEGLLFRGVPALVIDRKGDLCGYADPEQWPQDGDEDTQAARRKLRDRIAPAVYTPGHPEGRPLQLTLMPSDAGSLDEFELDRIAGFCAGSLCAMMGYGGGRQDQANRSLLKTALAVYAAKVQASPTLESLTELIDQQDPELTRRAGNLNPKTFDKVVQDLEVLRLDKRTLFSGEGEELDPERFFATRADGRTPLSIVSTKFLGDSSDIEFWIAQLLVRLGRWINQRPAQSLQAVVFLDEADLYLPAQRQPATKRPMEDLLKRARSAGLGLLLATQSPGDLDYKCRDNIRTWCLGRIKEDTALRKMRPMLRQYPGDMERRLPAQEPGVFLLAQEGRVEPFQAERCLVPPIQRGLDDLIALARKSGSSA